MQTRTTKGMLVYFTLVYTHCQFSVLKSKFNLDIPAIKSKMGIKCYSEFCLSVPTFAMDLKTKN